MTDKKREPLLSVITTVYNTEQYVERCFDSIIAQSYKNIELIVVNNGSSGNIEEIIQKYKNTYPNYIIKYIFKKENVGLVHGYISGTEIATGDYITFIDSDDRISLDYYRLLIEKALNTGADMVAADFVYEYEDGTMLTDDYNPLQNMNVELCGEDVFSLFMTEGARSFYWNLMWNKIYRIDLWKKCYPHIKNKTEKLVLCQDIVFSLVFFAFSSKFVNVHSGKYYYLKRKLSGTDANSDPERFENQLIDLKNVFSFFEDFVKKVFKERYDKEVREWKNRYYRFFCRFIVTSSMRGIDKKRLLKTWKEIMQKSIVELPNEDDDFFMRFHTPFDNSLEKIREHIADESCQYVSFDVFDTLVLRPFWEPQDMFKILNVYFKKVVSPNLHIEFSDYRFVAEDNLRKRLFAFGESDSEITLEMIYKELQSILRLNDEQIAKLEEYEKQTEIQCCYRRTIAKELYDYAISLGKKVIVISDMYLPKETVDAILQSCGYTNISKIFISNECGHTKASGQLYGYVKNQLKIRNFSSMVHIGDNNFSDVQVPMMKGVHAFCLPRAVEKFCSSSPLFHKMFNGENGYGFTSSSTFKYWGTRCFAGLIANHLFDNPFQVLKDGSEFNADPYFVGYFALGPYIYAAAEWLAKLTKERSYSKIHFLARDGCLIKQAYDKYTSVFGGCASNYLYLSRQSLIPLMILNPDDVFSFSHFLFYGNFTPIMLLKIFLPLLKMDLDSAIGYVKESGFVPDRLFSNMVQCSQFLYEVRTKLFDEERAKTYYSEIYEMFNGIVGDKECTFDVGYSTRPEAILSKFLGKRIDATMLYCNEEKSGKNAQTFDGEIFAMNNYFPPIANEMMIELMISDRGPYCDGYCKVGKTYSPRFAPQESNEFTTDFMISILQNAAMEFVNDALRHFSQFEKIMFHNIYDMTYPLEYFIRYAPPVDMCFLQEAILDEDTSKGIKTRIVDIRNEFIYKSGYSSPLLQTLPLNSNVIGVKGALVNYFKKHTPMWLRPFAKRVKRFLKW